MKKTDVHSLKKEIITMDHGSPAIIRSHKGFTIVELLIVIGIGSLMAAISLIGVNTLLPKYRLNSAISTVRGDLYKTKILAAKNKNQHRIDFTSSSTQYTVEENVNGTWTTVVTRQIANEYAGVSVDTAASANPVFQPRGTSSAVTVELDHSSGTSKQITVSSVGRIKVQ